MSDHAFSRTHFRSAAGTQDPFRRLNAATLGGGCMVLAFGCLAAVLWNHDLAVQAGGTLLGVALMASGVIALLAGDE